MKPNDKDVFMGGDEGDEDEYNMAHQSGGKRHKMVGSRAQVWHGTAYKTAGGLTKDKIMMNKHGRVVSRKKHNTAKKEKRLEKAGYFTKKGKFGYVKKSPKKTRKNTRKR